VFRWPAALDPKKWSSVDEQQTRELFDLTELVSLVRFPVRDRGRAE